MDPTNRIYYIMWEILVRRVGAVVTRKAAETAGQCRLDGHDHKQFVEEVARMTQEQRSHFIRFCCACLVVRIPAMRSDGALTFKLFEHAGDVFEAMLGLWHWLLPEAAALRGHLSTRAGRSPR